jgi:preprotein translocase subunit YajC
MDNLLQVFLLLAEDPPKQPAAPQSPFGQFAIPMLIIGFLWYFLLLRPQLREQRSRKDLLTNLKKNDKVVTIGGIIGTVTNLTPDGKEVTLRIEDNAKIRMLRSSIQTVVTDAKDETPA